MSDSVADGRGEIPTWTSPLVIPDGSPAPRIRVMQFDAESIEECTIEQVDELEVFRDTPETTWIDIQGLGDESTLRSIAELMGIHEAALADAVHIPQRAKTQDYGRYILIVLRSPLHPFAAGDDVPQVCMLLGENQVLTFQERPFAFFEEVRNRVRAGETMIRRGGPALLTYALADNLIDRFYPLVDDISESLDEIESRILETASPDLVASIHDSQRRLTTLRRIARPQVDALYKLAHVDSPVVPDDSVLYLKDAEDRARQIMGRLDAARENATDLMGAVLAMLGHRQNEVMKVLTLVGSIFIPLTFLAGIYGMNFEYMPELRVRSAYPTLLFVMSVIAFGLVAYFRYRGWIGNRDED